MSAVTDRPVLEIKRLFDASPERVFDAWLNREEWQAWIGPEGGHSEVTRFEPKIGGHYNLVMHVGNGRVIPVTGMFKAIERPTRFALTWKWALADDGKDTLITVTLQAVGDKTELTLRHEGLPTAEDREGHGKGWNSTLNKLELYVKGDRK